MGWRVQNIAPMAQFLDTAVVGALGSNLGKRHHFFPIDVKFILKII